MDTTRTPREIYDDARKSGKTVTEARREAGVGNSTAYRWEGGKTSSAASSDGEEGPQNVAPPPIVGKGGSRAKARAARPVTEETAGQLCSAVFAAVAMMQQSPEWFLTEQEKKALGGPFADSMRALPSHVADGINTYSSPVVFMTTLASVVISKQNAVAKRKRAAQPIRTQSASPNPQNVPTAPIPTPQPKPQSAPSPSNVTDLKSAFAASRAQGEAPADEENLFAGFG